MSTVEEDVDRVQRVLEVLEGPMTVWVMKWSDRDGEGFDLYRTEASARDALLRFLDLEWQDCRFSEEEYARLKAAITAGTEASFEDGGDRWYSISTEVVNP